MNSSKRIFAIVDCNSFYVSCERVFNPSIAKKPVVVLSNNDGCVISRSSEAKKLGIKMGEPFFKVQHLIKKHGVCVYSSNYALYGDMSCRVMSVLSDFTPDIEIYSIDEAFLDISGVSNNYEMYATKIKKRIFKWTGIPVSIGISETKTLAKIANHIAKGSSHGVVSFYKSDRSIDNALESVDVSNVWGIGRQFSKFLKSHGIRNALELKQANIQWIKKNMSIVGLKTVLELQNISCIDLENSNSSRKSCCSSRSFGKPTSKLQDLIEAMAAYTRIASAKIRDEGLVANCLTIFITTNRYVSSENKYSKSLTISLGIPSNNLIVLTKLAIQGLQKIFKKNVLYQKAAVVLSGLEKQGEVVDLFQGHEKENKNLMSAVDKINIKYGRDMVNLSIDSKRRVWQSKKKYHSPRYTTCLEEIPTIRLT